jgi:acyl-CoA synthetase (NDP forming)
MVTGDHDRAAPRLDATGRPVELRDVGLDRFLHPRTIAVIGATDTPGRPNTTMWRRVRTWGEANGATVVPVNPARPAVDGIACLDSVSEVPGELDLAVILVRDAVEVFEQVQARGARFAVIFGAGFAESGPDGEARQRRLAELVATGRTRLLGPNTNLNAFETFADLPGPSVALITQSGHQGRPVFQAQELGIAVSHWAPTGNEVDLEFADFARHFADQPGVGAVAAYVEGFRDGRTLQLAADHLARRGTPLVVVKVGRTAEGTSMAKSHTGHLAGADEVTSAVFRQFGVTRVDGLDELTDVAATLARTKPPVSDGVCVYSISGGTGAHMVDLCAAAGLRIPELRPETQRALHQWIPPYLRVSNPVDSGGPPSTDERGRRILEAIVADPGVGLVICPITGAVPALSGPLARDLVAVGETTDKPILVVWGSPTTDDPAYTDVLLGSRLPVFRTFGNCVLAARAYLDWHAFRARYRSPFERPARRRSPTAATTAPLLSDATGSALSEHTGKQLLAAYGIAVSDDRLVASPAEAARAAASLDGPVVLKICSPDLAHKSDLGLVQVGLTTAAEVRRSARDLLDRAATVAPDARIEGLLVCPQRSGGVETVVGVHRDELFGPTVMFGMGGLFVEVYRDVTFRVPPFDRAEARRMVDEVRGAALLHGRRGRPAADVAALVDTILRVQRLAVDHADDLAELDVNPLLVLPRGAGVVALDALVVPTR